jgi:hypothetical protein
MPESDVRRRSSLTSSFAAPGEAGGSWAVDPSAAASGLYGGGQTEDLELSVTTASLGCGIKDGVGGVVVVSVVDGGEAERLGVKIGDLIHTVAKKNKK